MDVNKNNIYWLIAFLFCQSSELIAMIFFLYTFDPAGVRVLQFDCSESFISQLQLRHPNNNALADLALAGHMFITTDLENDLGEFLAFFEGEAKVLEGFLNAEIAEVKPQGSQRGCVQFALPNS